jgi:hypothetical protein
MDLRGEVVPDLLPRITAAAHAVQDAEDAWHLRIRHRDQLVTSAVDSGVSQRSVAEAAGLSRGRVIGILGNSQDPSILV